MKDRIARSVFWIVWSKGGVQLLSFLSTLVVARLLNPSDYGVMALAGIWTGTVAMVADMGLGVAIVQFRDLEKSELNACFWIVFGLGGLGYLALYAAAPAIAAWFAVPALASVLRVSGLSLLLIAATLVPGSLLQKRLELDKIARADIISAIVVIPIMLTLAWNGAGVWALVVGALGQAVVSSAVILWFMPWVPGFHIGGQRIREIIQYSASTLGARIGWAAYSQMDTFILGKLAGDHVLGFYAMAKQLAILPVTKISVVVNQLASPVMALLQTDRGRLRDSFLRVLRLVGCVTVPLSAGMAFIAEDFVQVVLGEHWLPIVPVFQLLCIYALTHSFEVLLPPVLLARYHAAFLFRWTLVLLLLMPIPFWAGSRWLGALGPALVWVIVYPIPMWWMVRKAFREMELEYAEAWRQIRPVTGAAAAMVIAMLVVILTLPSFTAMDRLVRLAAASVLGALVYGIGVFKRGGLVSAEMLELAGWLFRRGRVVTTVK